MPIRNDLRLHALAAAVLGSLGISPARAATITVNHTTCTLPNAIASANLDMSVGTCTAGSGRDVLQIFGGQIYNTELPAIVTDMEIAGGFGGPTSLGTESTGRLFFVGGDFGGVPSAPSVVIRNIGFSFTSAAGGAGGSGISGGTPASASAGGGGAGLGGAVFVYAGNVTFRQNTFSSGAAAGGSGGTAGTGVNGGAGGGGIGGNGGTGIDMAPGTAGTGLFFGGGGGGGGDKSFVMDGGTAGGDGGYSTGGEGGVSGTAGMAGGFGGGGGGAGSPIGSNDPGLPGASGGFGGGGGGGSGSTSASSAGAGGAGGFGGGGGGGGGGTSFGGIGGNGGFGGGGGTGGAQESGLPAGGFGGFGGGQAEGPLGGGGAGFGGAVFVRTGTVRFDRNTFMSNSASGGAGGVPGAGKGGAIFVLGSLTPSNGNASGYPAQLPAASGCENTFTANAATSDAATDTDNDDTFGVSRAALVAPCDDLFADGFE